MDFQVHQLSLKVIPMVMVLWRSNNVEGHSWEIEAEMCTVYPYLVPQ